MATGPAGINMGEVTPQIGATESGVWRWDQGGRLDDEWCFVCEVCETSGEGTPTDSGPQIGQLSIPVVNGNGPEESMLGQKSALRRADTETEVNCRAMRKAVGWHAKGADPCPEGKALVQE